LGHRSPAEGLGLPHGRLTGPGAGPQRGCHVAHAQDTTGQDASFTPGTVVRTRPAITLRPAPAAFQRPVPTAPLLLPIGGGHFHETSTEVHAIRPSPRQPHRRRGRGALSPPVFSLPVTPGWDGRPWASSPMLRTPQLPATHVEAETGHRALAQVLHLRHQSNLPRCLPLALMRPHAADNPTSTPTRPARCAARPDARPTRRPRWWWPARPTPG
jgi:hypothetical protein